MDKNYGLPHIDRRYDGDDNASKMRRTRRDLKIQAERSEAERKEKESKRLSDSIDKHFKTTFIGALSAFEKEFGGVWADGVPEAELTDQEYRWRKRWENVRNTILTNGNNERRATQAELREYTVRRDRDHVDINFTK
jgi:hypothetical protein